MKKVLKSLRDLTPSEILEAVLPADSGPVFLESRHPPIDLASSLIENPIGYFSLPIGIASYFVIDDIPRWIPMAIEETSVIASASAAAKWIQSNGGKIRTECLGVEIAAQIHVPDPRDPEAAKRAIEEKAMLLVAEANELLPGLLRRGGGFKSLSVRILDHPAGFGKMLSVDIHCDPCDAMGANLVTQAAEALKPRIEEITHCRTGMAIVSNLSDGRLFRAVISIPNLAPEVANAIQEASYFAEADPYRATTHNKGIFNGVDAVLIATGNDWRAVEAGGHAFAAQSGRYLPLSTWRYLESEKELRGELLMPMALGTVGGVTRIHPSASLSLKILRVTRSSELSRICAAVGLTQNLAALKALSGPGISRGHMSLHASNLARAAGANGVEREHVVAALKAAVLRGESISETDADRILAELRVKDASRL